MEATITRNTKNERMQNVVSTLTARTQLGQIPRRASERDERFVVDRRGKPSVMIMSVRDYIREYRPPTGRLPGDRPGSQKERQRCVEYGRGRQ